MELVIELYSFETVSYYVIKHDYDYGIKVSLDTTL